MSHALPCSAAWALRHKDNPAPRVSSVTQKLCQIPSGAAKGYHRLPKATKGSLAIQGQLQDMNLKQITGPKVGYIPIQRIRILIRLHT